MLAAPPSHIVSTLSLVASPNPAYAGTALRWSSSRPEHATLRIVDAGGRRIRTLADGAFRAGEHEARGSLLTEAGEPVPAGVYFAVLTTSGVRRVTRVAVMR